MKIYPIWLCRAAVLACSCGQHGAGTSPGPGEQASPINSVAGGGEKDLRLKVAVLSPVRGASSIDPQTKINLNVFCPPGGACASDVSNALKLISSKIRIIGSKGEVIAVTPEVQAPTPVNPKGSPSTVPVNQEYPAVLIPAVALSADAKYTLDLRSDSSAVLGFGDASAAEERAAIGGSDANPASSQIGIFTGSAPTVTRIDVVNDRSKPITSLRIRLSEPVNLSTLTKGLVIADSGGKKPNRRGRTTAHGSKSSKATSASDRQTPYLNTMLVACESLWTSNTS